MLLEMKNIVKRYGNLVANDHVSLHLGQGEILAVVGENGAGKSTIMKVLYGLEKPDEGEIILNGEKQRFRNPSDAMEKGIGMVQQHFMLFEPMTIAENIVYMNEIRRGIFIDTRKTIETIQELSERYKLKVNPQDIVENCSVGLKQRIEILKILYQNAKIIIFDEPSAVLTPMEVDELLKTMKHLAAMGKSIIIITHKLREVMEVADRAVVMRSGKVVKETLISETSIEELSLAMVGRQIKTRKLEECKVGKKVLDVKELTLFDEGRKLLDNINLHINAGEIVGIAGVSGNGQSEFIQCITGLKNYHKGTVVLNGADVSHKSVKEIREQGLAHIPEDRYIWGSALEATLEENALMGFEEKEIFSKHGILKSKNIREHCEKLIKQYNVKADSLRQFIRQLSGGNAQKLIVAREMNMNTPFIIACEPTRGIDIGAIEFIHEKLVERRISGDGVLIVSSELSEITSLCDRIYVMFEGKINGELVQGQMSEKELGLLMIGGASVVQ